MISPPTSASRTKPATTSRSSVQPRGRRLLRLLGGEAGHGFVREGGASFRARRPAAAPRRGFGGLAATAGAARCGADKDAGAWTDGEAGRRSAPPEPGDRSAARLFRPRARTGRRGPARTRRAPARWRRSSRTTSGSVAAMPPAIQPRNAAPTVKISGAVRRTLVRMKAPHTRMGMLIRTPSASSQKLAAGDRRERDHVVEAHRRVGEHDDRGGRHEIGRAAATVAVVGVGARLRAAR